MTKHIILMTMQWEWSLDEILSLLSPTSRWLPSRSCRARLQSTSNQCQLKCLQIVCIAKQHCLPRLISSPNKLCRLDSASKISRFRTCQRVANSCFPLKSLRSSSRIVYSLLIRQLTWIVVDLLSKIKMPATWKCQHGFPSTSWPPCPSASFLSTLQTVHHRYGTSQI